MRIVERIQRAGDVAERHVKPGRLVDLLPRFLHFEVPIEPMELRVVLQLAHVIGDVLKHRARPVAVQGGDLLGLLSSCDQRAQK